MDISTPTSTKNKTRLIAGILFVMAIGSVVFVTPRFLTGSLLPAEIAFALKDRADTDENGTLSAREIRRTLSQIVRQVSLQTTGYDINEDGSINRGDIQDSLTAFRSLLAAVCGNSATEAGERCDDGDTDSGDGCSATCTIENNYTCTGAPSACTRLPCDTACSNANILAVIDMNGDGVITMQEFWALYQQVVYLRSQGEYVASLDLNHNNAVDALDLVALNTFRNTPDRQICGNGTVSGTEACDDSDNDNGDGCSATCSIEASYACMGAPSVCNQAQVCNASCVQTNTISAIDQNQDGVYTRTEIDSVIATINSSTSYNAALDLNRDGVVNAADAALVTAFGASASNEVCGNGRVDVHEYCDDNNNNNGDGCSAVCVTEAPAGSDNQTLTSVHLTCESNVPYATVTYGKNYDSCTHMKKADGTIPHAFQILCETRSTNPIVSRINMQISAMSLTTGDRVRLCHPMILQPWACTSLVTVTGTSCDAPVCGNNVTEFGEQCDDGNTNNGDGCTTACQTAPVSVCGNGVVQIGEQCDDGNQNNADTCTNSCTPGPCGNGTIDSGEQCDDGNTYAYDTCTNQCRPNVCGDGVVRAYYEQCDDGNTQNYGDGCNNQCQTQVCGNGLREFPEGCDDASYPGCNRNTCQYYGDTYCGNGVRESNLYFSEECDDGNQNNNDSCTSICELSPPICGNHRVQAGETCDDGNTVNGDGCSSTCQTQPITVGCGNGIIDAGEICDNGAQNVSFMTTQYGFCTTYCQQSGANICGNGTRDGIEDCDDGNSNNTDSCTNSCRFPAPVTPVCGNGQVQNGEQCDDGNTNNGDGCNSACNPESGYTCMNSPSVCTTTTTNPVCGNGVISGSETCDDGDATSGDGCSSSCTVENNYSCTGTPSVCTTGGVGSVCGNGVREGNEQCDDNNITNGDGCDSACRSEGPFCGNGVTEPGEQCDDQDQNDTNACRNNCTINTTGAPNAELTIRSAFIGITHNAVSNEELLVHRFTATATPPAGTTSITIRRLEFLDDWGDLTNGFGPARLAVDTDGDGNGDDEVATATVFPGGVIVFTTPLVIPANTTKTYDVRVKAGPYKTTMLFNSPVPNGPQDPLIIAFNETSSSYVRATYGNTATQLANISLEGNCPTTSCKIAVYRNANIIHYFSTASNLSITGNPPPESSMILAGGESQPLMDLNAYVSGEENVALNQIAFAVRGAAAIESLPVYVNGVRVGEAKTDTCNNFPSNWGQSQFSDEQRYCAVIDNNSVHLIRGDNHLEISANVKNASTSWQPGTAVRLRLVTSDGNLKATGETSGYVLTSAAPINDGGNISFGGSLVTNDHTAE